MSDDDAEDDLSDPDAAAALARWTAGVRVVRAALDSDSDVDATPLLTATIEHEALDLDMVEVCRGTAMVAKSLLVTLEEMGVDPQVVLDLNADLARRRFGLPPGQTG